MREYFDMSDPIYDETNMKVIGKFEVEIRRQSNKNIYRCWK